MTHPRPAIDRAQIDALALELTAELTEASGSADDVSSVLGGWLDRLGTDRLALVGLAVVRDVFALHLTRVPRDDLSPGDLVMTERSPL